jgi:AcrR family transcriptional regulator
MMKKEKISNRKIQADKTKKKIYETAYQLFDEFGFENVSIDSIVEAAGVSKGAFYVHFYSKDSLIAALINDYVNKVDLDYKSFLGSYQAEIEASDIIISLIGKISDVITDTVGNENIKALYKAQITKTIDTNTVMDYNRELYKMFNDVICKGVQQDEFRADIPVDTLARHFIMAIRGLTYEWCVRYPDFDLKEQVLKHFEILLTGIKNR